MRLDKPNPRILLGQFKHRLMLRVKHFYSPHQLNKFESDLKRISSQPDFGISKIIESAIDYTEKLRYRQKPYGQYLYKQSGKRPILYASVFAALFRHLVNDLTRVSNAQREEWANYIRSYQCADGLFRDPLVANDIAEVEDWWGWRHLTVLSLMALNALDSYPNYSLNFLEPFDNPSKVSHFIDDLDWGKSVSFTSNKVQNYVASLQYARDFLGYQSLDKSVKEFLNQISSRANPENGLWGSGLEDKDCALSEGIQAGYHFWLLFWYEGIEIPYQDKVFSSLLRSQNKYGGFNLKSPYASACEDIDSLYPMIEISLRNVHFRDASLSSAKLAIPFILTNFNRDGGACFVRGKEFVYGHPLMKSSISQSSIFATWFRTLSLSYCINLISICEGKKNPFNFRYLACPGYQLKLSNYNT
ncbi:MAG: hypothetical protein ACHWZW_21695 [Spirulina sp.]